MNIKKIYRNLVISEIKNTEDIPDVSSWISFLESLPAPKDRIDESFLKYQCRMFSFPLYKSLLLNCASLFVLTNYIVKSFLNHETFPLPNEPRLLLEKKTDVLPYDVYPESIQNEFEFFDEVEEGQHKPEYLTIEGKRLFYKALKRHPFKPYYLLWIVRQLSKHCYYITQKNPLAVLVYVEERNVAGPIITELYESSGRELCSFMHGEYLLQLIQAYMDFSRYYIWDDAYKDMFADSLNCSIQKYCVYTPKKLTKKWCLENVEPDHFCTYYFSGESRKAIKFIADLFIGFENKGKRCKIRPHPRYSNLKYITECFPPEMIEDPHKVTMEMSLGKTEYVIGLSTTVHSEALIEGRTVVVDDISEPDRYENLKERKYVVLTRPHILLSDLKKSVFGVDEID